MKFYEDIQRFWACLCQNKEISAKLQCMSSRLAGLADVVRIAARSYDAGKRDTAFKLLGMVASKLAVESRQRFLLLIQKDIQHSGIKVYVQSIILGHGGSPINSKR